MSLSIHLQLSLQLSTDETRIAEELFTPITFNKGDIFINPIQKNIPMYYITEGYVRVYALQDGKEITQWIGSPHYFMTDLTAWLFNAPIKWTVEALTPVTALCITKSDYDKLSIQVNNWAEKERKFIGHCFEQMEKRIFQFISLNAEQRYIAFFDQLGHLFNEVPHQYIASMLGMTPETLSRLRKKTV
ncbi:Crp/Fnr family transcriptional regulator [Myroides marinus]|uniref:Crp/Fnr family transcriptional regulator n=1 Tax=Myroides marinus TaxID=703342 RepID=UPI0025759785|nr:Crp/Fnr family transcriptional regulator [Myroides marinus]MDM1377501.1 Crp/Fnr family transcriptional regulator [Myroides marinus]MDM1384819.1 Crp/Fnr family transcriptional regulator [Myroides marinus]MDM1388789.1 Crp/Fnr family transcriptional regulator [Myroides marinus]MDM1391985.1 Crp/Fnr family transcriptional regulator [Myroides marinus]